jgi:hypothetical protein
MQTNTAASIVLLKNNFANRGDHFFQSFPSHEERIMY